MRKFLLVGFLSVAVFVTSAAQAMQIQQFDKMADQDQADYISQLVAGAQTVLIKQGQPELAAKVHRLFTEIHPGDTMSVGLVEFENNLAILRLNDAKEVIKNPKAVRLEAEDVMIATLHANHIELPDSFYTVNKNFTPKHVQQSKDGKKDKKN